jgi:ABC-type Fe3+/spermidine/putrescine transport system ATPase subunit
VYERPVNSFVAGFIGISNLLDATAEAGGVRLSDGTRLPLEVPEGVTAGAGVKLSVRPEKLTLQPGEGRLGVAGTVAETVYLGTVTHVVLDVPGGARVIVVEQNTEVASQADRPALGAPCSVYFRPEHARVLAV